MTQTAAQRAPLLREGTRLLHIGPPKTGTTTVQAAFHEARQSLAEQGVHYAGPSRHARQAVFALVGKPWLQGDPPGISRWTDLVAEIRAADGARVVLSSEGLSYASYDTIRRAVSDLDRTRVHVVVTLRPLARILTSQWQQLAQAGTATPLDAWLRSLFRDTSPDPPSFWYRHRHDRLVQRWAEVVGPDNVTVVVLDDRDRAFVLRAFEELLGLREGTLVPQEDLSNRSLTLPEVEAVRALNAAIKAGGMGTMLQKRAVRRGAAAYLKARPPSPDWPKIQAPRWALEQAREIEAEIVSAITASGVRVVGDLDLLADVPPGGAAGDDPPAVSIEPALAASLAMGVLSATGIPDAAPRPTGVETSGRTDMSAPLRRAGLSASAAAGFPTRRLVAVLWARASRPAARALHSLNNRVR